MWEVGKQLGVNSGVYVVTEKIWIGYWCICCD